MKKIVLTLILFGAMSLGLINAQTYQEITGLPFTPGFNPAIQFFDMDNDNDLDVIIAGNTTIGSFDAFTSLYENDGNGNYTLVTGNSFEGVGLGDISIGDIDGDNDPDILIVGKNSSQQTSTKLYGNNGNGSFSNLTGTGLPNISHGKVILADLDNDGDNDVVLSGSTTAAYPFSNLAKIYTNNGNGFFSVDANTNLTQVAATGLTVFDANNDGDMDIILSGYVGGYFTKLYENNGVGAFTESTNSLSTVSGSITTIDANNDNYQDVIIAGYSTSNSNNTKAELFINDGTGSFSEVTGNNFPATNSNVSMAVTDYNGDNHLDVFFLANGNGSLVGSMFMNDGSGVFTENTSAGLIGLKNQAAATADIDNDQKNEIIIMGVVSFGAGAVVKVYEESAPCTVNIPDANFKNYLLGNTGINTNGDTEIQCDEASAFTGNIGAANSNISDITGIEAFTEITGLNCWNNSISNVDLSQNTKLLNLTFTTNNLSSLDLSNQPLLETLDLAGNNISSLDVSIFTNLTHLNAAGNNLQNINLTNNSNLINLYIANNSITTVDISQNPDLETLDISHLTIGSELDLSSYTNLSKVFVENTGITKLNIANGNNTNFTFFNATNNPSLTCVQVDDVAWSTTNWADWNEIDDVDLFNANCSGGISCTVNIPNANFKSCLVNNMLINTNGDSEISCDEAAAFTGEMDCSWAAAGGLTFSDMTGVEAFTAMTELQLNSQNMTSLDLTANVALEKIDFHQNFDLTSLNITGLTNLVELKCFSTGLPTLDVSTNSALESLQCDRMNLTSLDVSGLTNLKFLDCYNNDITSIDVTGCTALQTLRMQDNQLANVDFLTANNPIQDLWVGRNPLTTFTVSILDSLKSIWLDDNDLLTNIDLSQNTALITLRCFRNDLLESVNLANTNNENFWLIGLTENPSLICLQVDDLAWSNDPANWDETATNMYGHFFYSFDSQTNFSADCGITSSISKLDNPNIPFSIYPNPTNQQLNIEIENAEISQIDIIDLSGKIVRTIPQKISTVDVSNLNNGIYFIKIQTDKGVLNNRFVKI